MNFESFRARTQKLWSKNRSANEMWQKIGVLYNHSPQQKQCLTRGDFLNNV